ncbi:MAG TPA: acyl-CoA desaturase [Polyangiaceae bacterium]
MLRTIHASPKVALRRLLSRASLLFFVVLHLSCLLVVVYPPTWPLVLLAASSYAVRMWAVTAGYHRYFAHRSFRTSRTFQFILAFLGCTALENGPLWWASWHRRHHKYADTWRDSHSPRVHGLLAAHVGWVFDPKHDETDLSNVADLTRFPELRLLERFAWVPLVGFALLCFAVAGVAGLVWGFVVSTLALNHATFLVNSLGHVWGTRRYATPDDSRNNVLIALLTFGEGWHNNHHFCMSSARQGFRWWELDLAYYGLKALAWLRVVHDLREPSARVLAGEGAGRGRAPPERERRTHIHRIERLRSSF